jgi:hypothetical protein
MLKVAPISTTTFSAAIGEANGNPVVSLSGNADTLVLSRFSSFIQGLHAELTERGLREIQVDTGKLYFMTSSCLKVLVTWLTSIKELDAKKRYQVVFLSNPDLHWQRRSFEALRHIADGAVTIQPGSVPKVKT